MTRKATAVVTRGAGPLRELLVFEHPRTGLQLPAGTVEDGGKIVLVRERWLGRPGDVVRVGLRGEVTPPGYYVPSDAIQFDGQNHYVSVAQASGDGHETVRVAIEPGQTVGKLQRIQSADDGLQDGMKVILNGAHYVEVGEQVNPVEEVEVQP